uniref:Small capsomere-interacting protein n=1 Tax=Epstein-Barr virus (strain GD1) TaxID=10376 RepID=A0A3R5TNM1_EBVG|nr:BFRF3 [human gammaherpesvirus 4]
MARRLPKPTLQGRLEADFPDSPLLPKFQELNQNNLPNDVFREAQRSYLVFLTSQFCYEEYVQRTFGVPRRQRAIDKRQRASVAGAHAHLGGSSATPVQQAQAAASAGTGALASSAPSTAVAQSATPSVSSSISSLRAATSGATAAASAAAAVDTGSGGGGQPQDTAPRGARKKQ